MRRLITIIVISVLVILGAVKCARFINDMADKFHSRIAYIGELPPAPQPIGEKNSEGVDHEK